MDKQIIIKCPRHPKRQCQVFTSQISSPCCLLCIECLQVEAIQPLSLVTIEDILNGNKDTILKNWPPLGSKTKELFQNLIKITTSLDSSDLEKQIINIFESAEKKIIEALREKKKEALIQLGSATQNKEKLIKEYQQIAQINQLKKVLTLSEDSMVIEKELRLIIEDQSNKTQVNFDKLQQIINLSQLTNILTFNESLLQVNKFIEAISILSLLSQNLSPNSPMQKVTFVHFEKETNSLKRDQQTHLAKVDTLLKNSLLTTLEKSTDLPKADSLVNFEQEGSQLIQKDSLINFKLQIELKSKAISTITCSQSNDSSLSLNQVFTQSGIKCSEAYCSMENLIKCDKKYILKLTLVNNKNFSSSVSLIPQNQDCNNGMNIIQFFNFGNSSFSKVIKGQEIWSEPYYRSKKQQYTKKIVSVEMRICIKDKQIVVFDRPSYSNSISISSWSPDQFVSNSDYKLRFYIYGVNDSITVEELREVDNFPDI